MTAPTVVTITRQFACGGAEIGRLLAERLGFYFADREILEQAADELDVSVDDIAWCDEHAATVWEKLGSALKFGTPEVPCPPPLDPLTSDELYAVESRIIQHLATRESCIVVGRGAAYVLREHPGATRILLYAPESYRIHRLAQLPRSPTREQAVDLIRRSDRARQAFIARISGWDWLSATNFHLCLDTSAMSVLDAVDIMERLVQSRSRKTDDDRLDRSS